MGTSNRTLQPVIPRTGGVEWKRKLAAWMRQANQGKLASTGTVTLEANARTTRVEDNRAGRDSFVGFVPSTASAAREQAQGTLFVSGQGTGYFVISHQENDVVDRTFSFTILG